MSVVEERVVQERQLTESEIERLCSRSLRAVTQSSDMSFTNGGILNKDRFYPVRAAHLQFSFLPKTLSACRAVGDSMGFRILHSDHPTHRENLPDYRAGQEVLDLLEQIRTEQHVDKDTFPGIRKNLLSHFTLWAEEFVKLGHANNPFGSRFLSVAVVCWCKINGVGLIPSVKDIIMQDIVPIWRDIQTDLTGLAETVSDQTAFAKHALNIADIAFQKLSYSEGDIISVFGAVKKASALTNRSKLFQSEGSFAEEEDEEAGSAKKFVKLTEEYQVFTKANDAETIGKALISATELERCEASFGSVIRKHYFNSSKALRSVKPYLCVPERIHRTFGHDAGFLDGGKLSRIISNPNDREIYWQFSDMDVVNAAVTILVDCSAPMQPYADRVALLARSIVRVLDRAKARTEILGYTTREWNGGQSMRDWEAAGAPENPGRINDVQHIIFKAFDQRFMHARHSIAAMTSPEIYKESFSGEAVLWAGKRLKDINTKRHFMVVLTNSAPSDTMTAMMNPKGYLNKHLRYAIQKTRLDKIRVMGLGIEVDVTPFYIYNRTINFEKDTLEAQVNKWIDVMQESFTHRN